MDLLRKEGLAQSLGALDLNIGSGPGTSGVVDQEVNFLLLLRDLLDCLLDTGLVCLVKGQCDELSAGNFLGFFRVGLDGIVEDLFATTADVLDVSCQKGTRLSPHSHSKLLTDTGSVGSQCSRDHEADTCTTTCGYDPSKLDSLASCYISPMSAN
jgi:hypothetical protein